MLRRINSNIELFMQKVRDAFRYCVRWFYFPALRRLIKKDTTIICNNCLGGRIYKDLGYAYNTPTVGLFFNFPDYLSFLKNLESNLKASMVFIDRSKYADSNAHIKNIGYSYPIGVINGDVEIHFLHYKTECAAQEAWRRRADRVNLNDLVVLAEEIDMCTEELVREFSVLPFERKFIFTINDYDIPHSYFVRKFHKKGRFPNPWRKVLPIYKLLAKAIKQSVRSSCASR